MLDSAFRLPAASATLLAASHNEYGPSVVRLSCTSSAVPDVPAVTLVNVVPVVGVSTTDVSAGTRG